MPERSRGAVNALESRSRLVAELAIVPDQLTVAGDDCGVVGECCYVAWPGRCGVNGDDRQERVAGVGVLGPWLVPEHGGRAA